MGETLFNQGQNEYNIRSEGDLVSALQRPAIAIKSIFYPTNTANRNITVKSESVKQNPNLLDRISSVLTEHSPNILDRLDQDMEIGAGRCHATNSKGGKCKCRAIKGQTFCRHHMMKGGAITLDSLKSYAMGILDANGEIPENVKSAIREYISHFDNVHPLDRNSPADRQIGHCLSQILRNFGTIFLNGNLTLRHPDDYNDDIAEINHSLNGAFRRYRDIRRRQIDSKLP